jgi:hypothetical protein
MADALLDAGNVRAWRCAPAVGPGAFGAVAIVLGGGGRVASGRPGAGAAFCDDPDGSRPAADR